MTALEEIKKALEGVTPERLRYEADAMFAAVQGEQYGDTFHAYNWDDKPHRVLYDAIGLMREAASTLESLQRENAELVSRANEAVEAANALQVRADAAQHREKNLRETLAQDRDKVLAQVASIICEETCGLTSQCKSREAAKALFDKGYLSAYPALASTGGEHHAE